MPSELFATDTRMCNIFRLDFSIETSLTASAACVVAFSSQISEYVCETTTQRNVHSEPRWWTSRGECKRRGVRCGGGDGGPEGWRITVTVGVSTGATYAVPKPVLLHSSAVPSNVYLWWLSFSWQSSIVCIYRSLWDWILPGFCLMSFLHIHQTR